MKKEDMMAALEAISKSGITVKGDLVLEKKVDYEVAYVENGGIGIQIINGKDEQKGTNVEHESIDGTSSAPENSTGDDNSKLNFFAPKKVLKEMLLEDWFDSICVNKDLYHKEWRENLVDGLMASEHRVYIAKQWQHADKWLTIKGQFVGALVWAGILRGSNLAIARTILGISHNTRNDEEKKEANTFAKYMGQGNKEPYADWIKTYVTNQKDKA